MNETTQKIISNFHKITCIEDFEKIKEYCDKEIKLINDKINIENGNI